MTLAQQNTNPMTDLVDLTVTYDNFMRMVSHELRTPLHLIRGYSELLDQGAFGELHPPQKEALEYIIQSTSRLNTVVEHITTLLALDKNTPLLHPMSLVEIVVAVMVSRHEQAYQQKVALKVDQANDLPPIMANAQQLYQAVDSLVDNALKFTPAGGTITIKSYQEKDWVCLAIEDTGIGISPESKAHIFSLFYQADSTTTRPYEGTGLGLSVVKGVAEAHGGYVDMASIQGQGSTFVLKLPVQYVAKPAGNSTSPVRTRHILVVDDEEHITLVLKDGLESLPNCTVVTAHDGAEALTLFEQQPFDLIITDYKMPVTDGLTLVDHIRHIAPEVKVIMITAHFDEYLQEKANQVDIQRLLQKPLRLDDIRSAASEVLAENKTREEE